MLRMTAQGGQPYYAKYSLDGDILTVDIDGTVEVFDFTEMPDGRAEHIEVELLPTNPILDVQRINGELDILVIYWYTEEEKDEYESLLPEDIEIPWWWFNG